MHPVNAYAANQPKTALKPFQIQRRDPGPNDVVIKIKYCGVCHSDIHQARDEWGGALFPMVPGHEIIGKVSQVGSAVSHFQIGDTVGVGCITDSCRTCDACKQNLEQFCQKGVVYTYNSREKDGKTPTYGGYSTEIVVDEKYVLKIPENLPLDKTAPLLCAGITTYSPLRHWNIKKGDKMGVIGLGGLGHMAIKIGTAMGAEVTVFSTSPNKQEDALRLGAQNFALSSQKEIFTKYANYFDLIINTAAGNINLDQYLSLLKQDAIMVLVSAPEKPDAFKASSLIMRRRHIAGSLIGGIKETQEMLDFCSKHNITSDIELIPIDKVNEAYDRVVKGDVKYRFVIDIENSLK